MSLRDQLVAKGFAKKGDKARVERELKQTRKKKRGQRQKKSKLEREQEQAAEAELQRAIERRNQVRKLNAAQREAIERRHRIRRMVLDSEVRSRGSLRFHFKKLDGKRIDFISVHPKVGRQLRSGWAGIAAAPGIDEHSPETYHVVPVKTARRLLELASDHLVFFVQDTAGIDAPDEDFLDPEWEISLAPRRLR